MVTSVYVSIEMVGFFNGCAEMVVSVAVLAEAVTPVAVFAVAQEHAVPPVPVSL